MAENPQQPAIPDSQATQIREFVFAGRKIEAIKLLRQFTPGMDLKDAKTVIEQLEAHRRQESPEKFTARKSGCTVQAGVFLLVLILLLLANRAFAAGRARDFLKRDDSWCA